MTSTQPLTPNWRDFTPEDKGRYLARLREKASSGSGKPYAGHDLPWRVWLERHFPAVATAPLSSRHERLWEWFDALTPGVTPRARVEVWPRGGAKSSTAELGCARVAVKLSRRYVLYVSNTQAQADDHVQAIAGHLASLGMERAVNQYGASKGWSRSRVRTENGFNIVAYGLDSALRGTKLDQYRPDLIIFDDIDAVDDTPRTVEKKINVLTKSILPTGSTDCAVLVLQNKIHEDSIVSQLVDGRADFLHDRELPCVEPAVHGLTVETVDRGDGVNVYRVTGGEPTWAGQNLKVCEEQINQWGLRAFKEEAQHEVEGAQGYFFNVNELKYIDADLIPDHLRWCRAWDLAATEGGGDWTVGVKMGRGHGKTIVVDVRRGQWGSENVAKQIEAAATEDTYRVKLRLPQDPGQAGKTQADHFEDQYKRFDPTVLPVTGKKATRAKAFAEELNLGNVYLVRAPWNYEYVQELRRFREDLKDQQDDQVDASADAFNELNKPEAPPIRQSNYVGAPR